MIDKIMQALKPKGFSKNKHKASENTALYSENTALYHVLLGKYYVYKDKLVMLSIGDEHMAELFLSGDTQIIDVYFDRDRVNVTMLDISILGNSKRLYRKEVLHYINDCPYRNRPGMEALRLWKMFNVIFSKMGFNLLIPLDLFHSVLELRRKHKLWNVRRDIPAFEGVPRIWELIKTVLDGDWKGYNKETGEKFIGRKFTFIRELHTTHVRAGPPPRKGEEIILLNCSSVEPWTDEATRKIDCGGEQEDLLRDIDNIQSEMLNIRGG